MTAANEARKSLFFFWLALFCLAVALAGFGPSFIAGVRAGFDTVPLRLHIHGLIMMSWVSLLVVQAWLPAHGLIALHKRLGKIAIALFVLVVASAASLSINSLVKSLPPPIDDFVNRLFSIQIADIVLAVTFFTLALSAVARDTQAHRRYMTALTLVLLGAAVFRFKALPGIGGPEMTTILWF